MLQVSATYAVIRQRLFLAALMVSFATIASLAATPATALAQDDPHAGLIQAETDIVETDPKAAAEHEAKLLSSTRQLTFEGRRAGEGYFNATGSELVFQSEREPGNPFFQIYLMDLETGDTERISPGHGKTTCAWIHPKDQRVLFASTHDDPEAREKQRAEIELRESGQERRYSWDYDEHYEIYQFDRANGDYVNLTNTRGYDAEGSYSPNGEWIAFASNRLAYSKEMSEREREMFEMDPAYMMDIYLMRADGSEVRQLTDVPGYDGGPFFSPDGSRICWRRFAENGATAEIYTMNLDGSDQRQLTKLNAMSWAPYYHPSGEYLIFATNKHGFANFELYMVDAGGMTEPVRVTYTAGFDGLPVFSPDGQKLAWTSNRTSNKQSQLHLANWNHEYALSQLKTGQVAANDVSQEAREAAAEVSNAAEVEFTPADIMRHVDYLCRPELGGRLTGTRGEKLATAYVAAYFEHLGMQPAGGNDSFFQEFEFTSGVRLGSNNRLAVGSAKLTLDEQWRPLSFSQVGEIEPSIVAFGGYGITAPASEDFDEYDSYVHLDVTDKWVLMFRYMPEGISAERRQQLSYHTSLRYKAMVARDKGARGMIVVSGPNSNVRSELVPLSMDGSGSGSSIPVISITDEVARQWLATADKDLDELQTKLDKGDLVMGFDLPDIKLTAEIDLQKERTTGRNVLGRLQVGDEPSEQIIVVGAHIDHLGKGGSSSSLAREDERGGVHRGADDNASGVAGMLEIAEYLANQLSEGKLKARRDIVFAAWSGEELGTLGSTHYTKTLLEAMYAHGHGHGAQVHGHSAQGHSAHGESDHGDDSSVASEITATNAGEPESSSPDDPHADPHADAHASPAPAMEPTLQPYIAAAINMDMIGRMRDKLILQGIGSSSIWSSEIERRNAPIGLPLSLVEDCYLPTDATEFYTRGVPILSAFTGSHGEYHTPRDTPDKLNYDSTAQIARLMGLITRSLSMREEAPDYIRIEAQRESGRSANLRAWLGTVPEYGADDVKGVPLSGVHEAGPAKAAGIRGGDVIVELAGRKIENIYDYTYAIEALKIGQTVNIVVLRKGERIEAEITPKSRD